MKKFPAFLLTAALLIPAALSAATFEGKVTMRMVMPKNDPIPVTQSVKEGFSRTDMSMAKGLQTSVIVDQAKQQMIILMNEQKMYMVQPLLKAEDVMGKDGKDDFTFEKTNETEKIVGYPCVKYIAKSKDTTSEIWATDQLGTYLGMGGGAGGQRGKNASQYAWEKALIGKNFFPLRTVVFGKDGKEAMRMEALTVEKQTLPAALFIPPADYQKLEMPPMGDMMKGMMKGMMGGGR